MKKKGKKVIIVILIIILISIAIYACFCCVYYATHKKGGVSSYEMGSDKIIITKYNSNKAEEKTVTLTGSKRKQVLKMFEPSDWVDNYNSENFDYDYKIDFANGKIGYLNSTEGIVDIQKHYVQITEEECKLIEDFLQ